MTGWPGNLFQRKQNQDISRRSHGLGTTIELSESVPSPILAKPTERTQTSPYAADIASDHVQPSHIKRLRAWWSHTIRLNLDHGAPGNDPRDYLALERTFLGWFRTSVALISFGVVITQLFVLKDVDPLKGKVLGVVMACGGIMVVLLGCVRYFKQQRLLTQGKALSGGWHHQVLIGTLLAVLVTMLIVVILDG